MDELTKFEVSAHETDFFVETRCFDMCVTSFKQSLLNPQQKTCIKQCIKKHEEAEKLYLNKLRETMEHLAMVDPSLRLKFQQKQGSAKK